MYEKILVLILTIYVTIYGGCSPSVDDNPVTDESSDFNEDITPFLASQGLELEKVVEVYSNNGYLAFYSGKFAEGVNAEGRKVGPIPKRCMILTGKPYSMDYQSAMLMPEEGYRMMTVL